MEAIDRPDHSIDGAFDKAHDRIREGPTELPSQTAECVDTSCRKVPNLAEYQDQSVPDTPWELAELGHEVSDKRAGGALGIADKRPGDRQELGCHVLQETPQLPRHLRYPVDKRIQKPKAKFRCIPRNDRRQPNDVSD